MITLVAVPNVFQGRVVAARLGACGVVAQLRGGGDGPYPVGEVCVEVPAGELDLARQLLLADEVEAAFSVRDEDAGGPHRRHAVAAWVTIGAAVVAEAVAVISHVR